ncbi:MAG TPA: hypothetical protein VKP67_28940 [Xanthobacteraceae bacterium]|nr:hypothetical protein [Xanthobacteraceae bacterium]
MDNRFSGLIVTAAIAAAASAAISVSVTRTSAQGPAVSGAALKTPPLKTAWGEPDLQGIWTDEFETPLQRPAKYANQEFFTEAQRAELDQVRSGILGRRATERDANNGYNGAVFFSTKRTGARTSKIADPLDGRIPALTPEAQKAAATDREFRLALVQSTDTCKKGSAGCAGWKYDPATSPRRAEVPPRYITRAINRNDGPEDSSLGERCLTGGLPEFGGNTGSFRRIVQTPGGITMFYDVGQGQGWQRNIVMDGSPHLPANIRQWYGDSRGHWEGDTLVVDVTNFSPKTDFQGSRENLHLVERWTRTGPTTLAYEVTIEDPTVWTRPWTVKQEFSRQSDEENRLYTEPRCIEGNQGLPGLLHGRRVEDLAFAQGRGPDPAATDNTANFASTVVLEDPLQQ